jgi:hypothetical protein
MSILTPDEGYAIVSNTGIIVPTYHHPTITTIYYNFTLECNDDAMNMSLDNLSFSEKPEDETADVSSGTILWHPLTLSISVHHSCCYSLAPTHIIHFCSPFLLLFSGTHSHYPFLFTILVAILWHPLILSFSVHPSSYSHHRPLTYLPTDGLATSCPHSYSSILTTFLQKSQKSLVMLVLTRKGKLLAMVL